MTTTLKDLTDKRFGKLVVISRAEKNKHGQTQWLCQCDCGSTKIVQGGVLTSGLTRSCGCLRQQIKNLTGQRFGRLVVISQARRNRHNQPTWLCQCDCGQTLVVRGCSLTSKNTKSCGCLLRETIVKHGMSQTRTYESWAAMLDRCFRPTDRDWHLYGGRGVKVCNRWLKFENFFEDMGERPEASSIDRIDPNGNYCQENCRWATAKEQANNRRNSHRITFKGATKTLAQWALELGIGQTTLGYRLRAGWSVEHAFTQPIDARFSPKRKETLED